MLAGLALLQGPRGQGDACPYSPVSKDTLVFSLDSDSERFHFAPQEETPLVGSKVISVQRLTP